LLIDAFANLKRADIDLILVGGKGWSYNEIFDRIKTHGLESRIRFTGYVSDAELVKWYNGAALLVLPSEYEGFGMPAAQAMACGTPVIASKSSALPEVTGNSAWLFETGDKTTLCEHMANVLDDPRNAATMRANGFEQARKFTWQHAANRMLKIYQELLEIE
jgi:glycosyltransferase involved in cell wall biosynthesis